MPVVLMLATHETKDPGSVALAKCRIPNEHGGHEARRSLDALHLFFEKSHTPLVGALIGE
jgi:hypothetical protein